ncbi:MAG: M20 aminoacylase family protein [Pseudorhodoplanes sp.]|uniref:M20 aminoacylase family protein n=1 Tax=Pseudorhodoplanes sp. TaxID=1934341 RepID=UPI003D104087
MKTVDRLASLQDDMRQWRHHLHQYPELALEEVQTSAFVEKVLKSLGVDEIHTGIGKTGLVAVIRGKHPGKSVGFRADMDALPIHEATNLSYASKTPGVMHACGHDGHIAMLLGATKYLAANRDFNGTVYAIFQPAEESKGGGRLMVEDGLFERFPMDLVFGMHNRPTEEFGKFFWRDGVLLAAAAEFDIKITGHGGHGAHPNRSNDPIIIAAHLVTALQTLIARRVSPVESGVVSVCQIEGGKTYNVIPEDVRLKGTARWFEPEVGQQLEDGIHSIASGIAKTFGATIDVVFRRTYPATVNDSSANAIAKDAAEQVVAADNVLSLSQPTTGTEDFAFMLEKKRGSYIILGAGTRPDEPKLHTPQFDFNDDVMPIGAAYWVTLAQRNSA